MNLFYETCEFSVTKIALSDTGKEAYQLSTRAGNKWENQISLFCNCMILRYGNDRWP